MQFPIHNIIILFSISVFLFSCQKDQSYVKELMEAEQYMQEHPDSSLFYLQKISSPEKLPEGQYALYCLLLTQAKDKTYATHTSDSLISIAAKYFESNKDEHLKAKSWYYMGRVSQDLQQTEKALDYYLKAASYAERLDDYKLSALTYNNLGILYRQQRMFDKAIYETNRSLDLYTQKKDTLGMIVAYRNIGKIYLFMDETDSITHYMDKAIHYYDQALILANIINHDPVQTSVLNDLGSIYEKIEKYDEAIQAIQSSISNKRKNNHHSYLSLGNIYKKKNMVDSAYHYFFLAIKSTNLYTQTGAYFRLYNLEKERHNYKQALDYKEIHQFLRDSIDRDKKRIDFLETIHQYEQKELKKGLELKSAQERIIYLILIIVLLISLIISFLIYSKKRLLQEKVLRSQDKKIQHEKEQRLLSEQQILQNEQQIEVNKKKIINKEEALQSVQRKLLDYETKLLQTENDLIKLRREEKKFRDKIFLQKGYTNRIRITGQDIHKGNYLQAPFNSKDIPQLICALNEVHNNFANRLHSSYPQLKEGELDICYLIKAGAKTSNISTIISMTPNAVSKKKKSILSKLGIIDKSISLEEFLENF